MVMYQQTGKTIFKLLKKIENGEKIFGTFEYLEEIKNLNNELKSDDVFNINFLTDVIKRSALYQILYTNELLSKDPTEKWSDKWNKKYQAEIVKSVKLHAIFTTATIFCQEVLSLNISQALKQKLVILCKIYACNNILKYCDGALLHGVVSGVQLLQVKDLQEELTLAIKPDMQLLTESSSATSKIIHSVVNDKENKLYSRLYSAAAHSRLNHEPVLAAVRESVKPLSLKLQMIAKI